MSDEHDPRVLDAMSRVLEDTRGLPHGDRLVAIAVAWMAAAGHARVDAAVEPGGFEAARASQLQQLDKMTALVRADAEDLDADRLLEEKDRAGALRHVRAVRALGATRPGP